MLSDTTWTEAAHWIAGAPPATKFRCTAQSRYRQPAQACEMEVRDDGSLCARFAQPQRAVTPGQSLVLYRSEEHTSELQSLMRISYAVFCLKNKTTEQ